MRVSSVETDCVSVYTIYLFVILCPYANSFLFIVPEDVAMGFTTIYGFAPRIFKGNDHRIGFGFRFGEHADLQILYEFGPQTSTMPLKERILPSPSRRSQPRRPFLELLVRAGLVNSYRFNVVHEKLETQEKKHKRNNTNVMKDVLQELD